MTEQHECEWQPSPDEWGGYYCNTRNIKGDYCTKLLSAEEVSRRLNATGRLNEDLVMGDKEMQAYEWAIKQGFQSVAADYARTLAQYIRRVKLAYANILEGK